MEQITNAIIVKRRQEIIGMFCDILPPIAFCKDDEGSGCIELQDWIGEHQCEASYSTNISIIDAAWDIAESQIENGMEENLDKKEEE